MKFTMLAIVWQKLVSLLLQLTIPAWEHLVPAIYT